MISIEQKTSDPATNISLDTLRIKKQMLVFVNTKKGAEAAAERIASKADPGENRENLEELFEKITGIISPPTKQCKRLGFCIKKGISFHHSGLHPKQREIVEESFREGIIKIICSTPTLAAGLDLPAYRVVIRDLKRFSGGWGMSGIPVLEYEQMSGRAGRPRFDKEGQAICIASSNEEREEIWEEYINGEPEEILSKLAVEPVMRTYVLSLIATGYAQSSASLREFMSKTFYAHQYKDVSKLFSIIDRIILKLEEWEFIKSERKNEDFTAANEIVESYKIKATKLGERVAELYIDPETANYFLTSMKRMHGKYVTDFSTLQMISWTNELRPLLRIRQKEIPLVEEKLVLESSNLVTLEPSQYSEEFDEFLSSVKTALALEKWMDETPEEQLLDELNITPGELNSKKEIADWLIYSCYELSKLQGLRDVGNKLLKTRKRLHHGVKEELLPLIQLKKIGRIRARKLFRNKIKDLGDVKKADISMLGSILGDRLAVDVKKQVGEDVSPEKIKVKKNKRKGQISLEDF